jgi:hypothetical protein
MRAFASDSEFRSVFSQTGESLRSFFAYKLDFGSKQQVLARKVLEEWATRGDVEAALRMRNELLGRWSVKSAWASGGAMGGGSVSDEVSYTFSARFTYQRVDKSSAGFLSSGPLALFNIGGSSQLQSTEDGVYLPSFAKPPGLGAILFSADQNGTEPLSFEFKYGTWTVNGSPARH